MNNLSDTYSVSASDVQPDLDQLARELSICDDACDDYSETDKDSLSLLINKFPRVAMWIKDLRQIDAWLIFFKLVEDGIFPPKNIAYPLWLDVVDYIATDNVHGKRYNYNEDVRSFWALGYKLFRGKFIRFMSGSKSEGHVKNNYFGAAKVSEEKHSGLFKTGNIGQ